MSEQPTTPNTESTTGARKPIVLKAKTRVRMLTDIMDMLDVWQEPELRDLSQSLIYAQLSNASDEEVAMTHDTFVSKTNFLLTKRAKEEEGGENNNSENGVDKDSKEE